MASDEHCSKPLYCFFSEEIFNLQYAQNVRLKSRIAHLYANKMRFCVGCFACAQYAAGLRLSACADTPARFASAVSLALNTPPGSGCSARLRRAQCAFAFPRKTRRCAELFFCKTHFFNKNSEISRLRRITADRRIRRISPSRLSDNRTCNGDNRASSAPRGLPAESAPK